MAMDMSFVQAATLAIALLGAVLGLLNTWRAWSLDRLKVRVTPAYAVDTFGRPSIAIDVVNLSSFPVTITMIGFTVVGGATHIQIPIPIFSSGDTLPIRLETRTSCTALASLAAFEKEQLASIDKAYVGTACGNKIEGDSGALRQITLAAIASLK